MGLLALGLAFAGASSADAAGTKNLRCFSDGLGSCTLTSSGAHLVNTSGPSGDGMSDAGVYFTGKRLAGRSLSSVDFSFSWNGTPGGGAPRVAISIDTDGDGTTTEGYAALDWNSCGNLVTGGTVSTTSATCPVYFGSATYANWDAFVAANPTYTLSRAIPFVIVDVTADVTVTDVTFG